MLVNPNHKIWQQIYPNLRDYWLENTSSCYHDVQYLERWMLSQGVKITRDNTRSSGRLWYEIELPDGDELIALLIKWG